MTEDEMDNEQDLAAGGRRLMSVAFDTMPDSGLAYGELQRRVRRRRSARRRVRTLVPAGAIAALGGATAVVVTTLTVAGAPSALAAVTAAASKTSAETFRVTATQSQTNTLASYGNGPATRTTGVFDLGRGLGEENVDGTPVRIIGGHIYANFAGKFDFPVPLRVTGGKRWLVNRQPWLEGRLPQWTGDGVSISEGMNGNEPFNPAALLGLLKSATSVTAEGPVSGPGWTGTKYAFTAQLPSGETAPFVVSGTVYVDNQGRVRRLTTAQTRTIWSSSGVKGSATETYDLTFAGFGIPVQVTAPPASKVFNLGQRDLYVSAGGSFAISGPRKTQP